MSLASDVAICNSALAYIGGAPIMNLDTDTSTRAVLCKQIYAPTRDAMLQEHEWNFAIGRVKLNRTTTTPSFGYTYLFALPVDFLSLKETKPTTMDYKLEAGGLLTDEKDVYVRYVMRVTDASKYSPKFRLALEYKLASMMAVPIAGDLKKAQLMMVLHDQTLGLGKTLDTQGDPTPTYQMDTFLEARW